MSSKLKYKGAPLYYKLFGWPNTKNPYGYDCICILIPHKYFYKFIDDLKKQHWSRCDYVISDKDEKTWDPSYEYIFERVKIEV